MITDNTLYMGRLNRNKQYITKIKVQLDKLDLNSSKSH